MYEAGFFGTSWPKEYGGQDLPPVYDVIVDEEIAKAGAPARPSLGYLVVGLSHHGRRGTAAAVPARHDQRHRAVVPGLLRARRGFGPGVADHDGDPRRATSTSSHGHKIWTSYSDVADWCLLLARTDKDVPKHKGISAFIVNMHQPGIEQRPLKMISGVTKEFGQVEFDGARVPAEQHGRRAR